MNDDMPESVREWERCRCLLRGSDSAYNQAVIAIADAAIADLTEKWRQADAERDAYRSDLADLLPTADAVGFYEENMNIALRRAETAEAERDELRRRMDDDCTDCAVGVEKRKREQAEAIAKELECCGNCGNVDSDYVGDPACSAGPMTPGMGYRQEIHLGDACHFTPSRWERRTG